jgi:Flp pilus assembly protein TadD
LLEVDSALATRRRGRPGAVEEPAIERLTERDAALLLPLSVLYLELERAALAAGRLPEARRARELAEDLAVRLAAGSSDSAPRRGLAAALLEALAADRIEARDSAAAAALLERAARLAPDRAAPWLTIGILYERDRVLDGARAAFDRVLAAEPGHREARLRRARVDLLAGRAEAGAELERLAREKLDWIGVVAAEERTRQLLAEDRDEAAIALLAPLVEVAPREASLQRALAYALERTGRRLAAREHVARATAATARPGTTPRKRYAEAPERLLLDRRVEVERAALLALPELAAALAANEDGR